VRIAILISSAVLFAACSGPSSQSLTGNVTPASSARQTQDANTPSNAEISDALRPSEDRLFFKPMRIDVSPGGTADSLLWYTKGLNLQPQTQFIPCSDGKRLSYFLGDPIAKGQLQGQGVFVQAPGHIGIGVQCKLVETASSAAGAALTATLHVTVVPPPPG